jgi:hypothetical protein
MGVDFESPLQRAKESFLSPVKTGSRDCGTRKPNLKMGATVLSTATPPGSEAARQVCELLPLAVAVDDLDCVAAAGEVVG